MHVAGARRAGQRVDDNALEVDSVAQDRARTSRTKRLDPVSVGEPARHGFCDPLGLLPRTDEALP
jgi:hypothetical protein